MNRYPAGSVVICRFAFTLRALLQTELETFLCGQGLPDGVGTMPNVVLFDYVQPDGQLTTLTGGEIAVDAVGAYHVDLSVLMPGAWSYRGYGQDGSGNPVAATPKRYFGVTAF